MLVFEFEQERLAGEVVPELMALVARGLIRLLDMLVVHRPGDSGHLDVVDSRTMFGDDCEMAGEVVATITPPGTDYKLYTAGPFAVTTGPHSIEFVGVNLDGGDNTAFIDAVSIKAAD